MRRLMAMLLLTALLVACSSVGGSPTASASQQTSPAITPTPAVTAKPTNAPTASQRPTASERPTATQVPSATPALSVLHRVAAGETLSLIAGRYSTTWQSIVYWNLDRYPGLDPGDLSYDPNRISVGWQLIVWPGLIVAFDAPLPTPAATLAPTPTSAPLPSSPSVLIGNGSRASGMVALTFDMGGRTDDAVAIVTWLRDHGVPATIFMTGSSIDTSAAAHEVMSIVNANPNLFDLGNHSYGHPDMTTLSAAQATAEVQRAERAIAAYAAQPTRPLFRPPYGAWDAEMLAGVGAAGYGWSVMWDVDTIDWRPISDGGPTAQQIVDKVASNANSGSIVLMHLGGYETFEALPGIVNGLQAQGLAPVTLETLLGL